MAQRLYEQLIPGHIRNTGESGVLKFMKGQDISHRMSVANRPDLAKTPHNMILEDRGANQARGPKNMTADEMKSSRSTQRIRGIGVGVRTAFGNAARASIIAGAMEATISSAENTLHVKRGRKDSAQAIKDTAKNTAKTVVVAGALAAGLTFAPPLGVFAAPIVVTTTAVGATSTVNRLYQAGKRDLPLAQFRVFFCKDSDCRVEYARNLSSLDAD